MGFVYAKGFNDFWDDRYNIFGTYYSSTKQKERLLDFNGTKICGPFVLLDVSYSKSQLLSSKIQGIENQSAFSGSL